MSLSSEIGCANSSSSQPVSRFTSVVRSHINSLLGIKVVLMCRGSKVEMAYNCGVNMFHPGPKLVKEGFKVIALT